MKMSPLKSATQFMLRPFTENIPFTTMFFISSCSTLSLYYAGKECYVYAIYILCGYFVATYLLSLLICLTGKVGTYAIMPFFLLLSPILSLFNLFCLTTYRTLITPNIIEIIAGTNINEAQDFITSQVSTAQIITFLATIVIIQVVFFAWEKGVKKRQYRNIAITGICFVCISAILSLHNPSAMKEIFYCSSIGTIKIEEAVSLKDHPHHTDVADATKSHPTKIVVILGESFAKKYSSLYGYEKETNPKLKRLANGGGFLSFMM